MRLGLQTICWGDRLEKKHWPELLPLIRDAGYEGIEVFQHPKDLPDYPELAELCRANSLELLGFSGGDLPRRLRYLRGDNWESVPKPAQEPFLYVESEQEDSFAGALDAGFRLALHYHHLSTLRTVDQALATLKGDERLWWLPDTAHLFISRQQPDALIKLLTDPDLVPRTCAIHLKDWSATFGRFSQSYARGFCMPGEGDVKLETVVQALQKDLGTRDLWAIVELDTTEGDGEDVARAGETVLGWLKKPLSKNRKPFTVPGNAEDQPLPGIAGKLLQLAAVRTEGFFDAVAKQVRTEFPAEEVFLCGVLTEQVLATVRGWDPRPSKHTAESKTSRDLAKGIGKAALKTRTFSLDLKHKAAALPVFNCFNPHAVRHVLVFRWAEGLTEAEVGEKYNRPDLAKALAMAVDTHIGHRCRVIALRAGRVAATKDTRRHVLDGVAKLIHDELKCDGVSVFVVNGARDRLLEGGSTGLEWQDANKPYYGFGQGKTGRVAKDRSYSIYYHNAENARDESTAPCSWEKDVKDSSIDSVLATAFFGQHEEVAGVVRCRNPHDHTNVLYFSEDDLALVEAAMLAVQPELETFAQYETASTGHTALVHEIRQPIYAIRGAVGRTKWQIKNYVCSDAATQRPVHYLDSVNTYLDIINEQATQYKYFVDLVLHSPHLELRPTKFFADIVAPAVDSFYPRFQNESLPVRNVYYGDEEMWRLVPWVMVDKRSMFQVVFNLLSNATKYRKPDPNDFGIRIWGQRDARGAVIHFEDNGIGIPFDQRDRVFARGGRIVDDSSRDTIPGFGIGLWVARSIVEAHGGTIDLTGYGSPTRFTIRLPERRG